MSPMTTINRVLLNRTGPDPYLETSTCTLEALVFCTMQIHDDPQVLVTKHTKIKFSLLQLNFLGEI